MVELVTILHQMTAVHIDLWMKLKNGILIIIQLTDLETFWNSEAGGMKTWKKNGEAMQEKK